MYLAALGNLLNDSAASVVVDVAQGNDVFAEPGNRTEVRRSLSAGADDGDIQPIGGFGGWAAGQLKALRQKDSGPNCRGSGFEKTSARKFRIH